MWKNTKSIFYLHQVVVVERLCWCSVLGDLNVHFFLSSRIHHLKRYDKLQQLNSFAKSNRVYFKIEFQVGHWINLLRIKILFLAVSFFSSSSLHVKMVGLPGTWSSRLAWPALEHQYRTKRLFSLVLYHLTTS